MPTAVGELPEFNALVLEAVAAAVPLTTLSGVAHARLRTALGTTGNGYIKDEQGVVMAVYIGGNWVMSQGGKYRLELEAANAPGF